MPAAKQGLQLVGIQARLVYAIDVSSTTRAATRRGKSLIGSIAEKEQAKKDASGHYEMACKLASQLILRERLQADVQIP